MPSSGSAVARGASRGPKHWIPLDDWTPTQLGLSMEVVVTEARRRSPGLVDPRSPHLLGTFEDIVGIMSRSVVIAHPLCFPGQRANNGAIGFIGRFNERFPCSLVFTVRAGGHFFVGCNEAGVICSDGENNPNGFTHCIECRNDFSHTEERARIGACPGGYTSGRVKYMTFDVNKCCKLNNCGTAACVTYVFDLLRWVAEAFRDPKAKVLAKCVLAAVVNYVTLLLHLWARLYRFNYQKQR